MRVEPSTAAAVADLDHNYIDLVDLVDVRLGITETHNVYFFQNVLDRQKQGTTRAQSVHPNTSCRDTKQSSTKKKDSTGKC